MICVFSIFSIILNMEGSNCLYEINSIANEQNLNRTGGSQLQQEQLQLQQKEKLNQSEKELKESFELLRYCFLITNLYVYSLFGIIIGVIIIIIWYVKY
jgi:hypothetical protein